MIRLLARTTVFARQGASGSALFRCDMVNALPAVARQSWIASIYARIGTKNLQEPSGLTVPSTILQAFGG